MLLLCARLLLFHAGLWAMGLPRAQAPSGEALAKAYNSGDYGEAGAGYRALALSAPQGPKGAEARRRWFAYLWERQGYGALELELKAQSALDGQSALWLAKALAAQSKWAGALEALDRPQPQSKLPAPDGAERKLLRAEALEALGDSAADEAYRIAITPGTAWPGAALAFWRAAEHSQRLGKLDEAEARYKRAERLDPSYSQAHKRLGSMYFERGRYRDAKTRLERALRVDPLDAEARDCLALLLKAEPVLLAEARLAEAKKEKERLGQKNPRALPSARAAAEPLLRVGLLRDAARFKFRTGSALRVLPLGAELPAGATYEMALRGKSWSLRRLDAQAPDLALPLTPTVLEQAEADSTLALFDVDFGAGYFWAGKEDRNYRASFQLLFHGLKSATLVNLIPLDSYLRGVLPSEMPSNWPMEAQLAQAVAARGDTLGKLGRHKDEGFDLCSEAHCQMYRGQAVEAAAASRAVSLSAGEILRKGGKPVGGIYMNSCGGHTQDPWDTWAGEPKAQPAAAYDGPKGSPWESRFPLDPPALLEFLDAAEGDCDAWCGKRAPGSPYSEFRWVARYSASELEATVARRHQVGRLLAVEPLERSPSGYVRRVLFVGSKGSSVGSSDYIRSAIKGLRSNFFYVECRRDFLGNPVEFLFHGGGWGHGVGMCQTGAAAMAAAGFKHAAILAHYFRGALLEKGY